MRYAGWNAAVATATLGVLTLLPLTAGPNAWLPDRWALLGWSIMALTAVIGGWALENWHGRPGSGFLAALSACILTRLFGAAAGALAAMFGGEGAIRAFLVGLVATFLPLQSLEIAWFVQKARRTTAVRG